MALSAQFSVLVTHLPDGKDPADIIKENPEQWGEYVRNAKHVIEFYLDLLTEHYSDTRTLRMKVQAEVITYILQLKSPIEQSHFVKQIAARIRL